MPTTQEEAEAEWEKKRAENNPCNCSLCDYDNQQNMDIDCDRCEFPRPVKEMIFSCREGPWCKKCFIAYRTAVLYCPECLGIAIPGNPGYPEWEFSDEQREYLPNDETCQGWCNAKWYD